MWSIPQVLTIRHIAKMAACDTNHEFGVQVSSNIGAKLTVEAAKVSSPEKPFLKLEIAVCSFPLAIHILNCASARVSYN